MPTSAPLSLRITDEDATFLATVEIPGAKTPSEKVRAILAKARRQHQGAKNLNSILEINEEMVRPALNSIREVQSHLNTRSDFVLKLYEKVPELFSELIAAKINATSDNDEDKLASLKALEAALAKEIFGLIEEVLDMGLTSRSRSYDPDLLNNNLEPIIEIVDLIKIAKKGSKS